MMPLFLALFLLYMTSICTARFLRSRQDTPSLPLGARAIPGGFEVTFTRTVNRKRHLRRGLASGSTGLGDNSDLLYSVPIELDGETTVVHLDTGSSDLWVITDKCQTGACTNTAAMQISSAALNVSGADVTMYYGDSTTGTFASGQIAYSSATIAGIAIENQAFVGVNATTNPIVNYGTAGIFGLFQHGPQSTTDAFVSSTYRNGPLLARIVQTNALASPMFSISLQRNTIDIGGGTGTLTVGTLPPGIDNSSLTWVPVRLYTKEEGGLQAPSFSPNEVYPYRWEIDIEGVYLDGNRLPASNITSMGGVDNGKISALIDTGNSLLRGPADTVKRIIEAVATDPDAVTLPCSVPHTLSYMIGGKLFPIDPRDFVNEQDSPAPQRVPGSNDLLCKADNIVSTDPPNVGALFRWSLGDPFFKSNLVAFHYGNLTHPNLDPPRIGILSTVPSDAGQQLQAAVQEAIRNGGFFESTLQPAPTGAAAAKQETTVVPESVNFGAVNQTTQAPQTSPTSTTIVAATMVVPATPQETSNDTSGTRPIRFNNFFISLVMIVGLHQLQ